MTASPPAPKDFTEVSPESVGVRVKLDAALDFLRSLKGEAVEVGSRSLAVSCDALRAGEQTINLTVDPERAAALIAKARSMPGVVAAGWTSGSVEMDRTIRFAAADGATATRSTGTSSRPRFPTCSPRRLRPSRRAPTGTPTPAS